MAGIQGICPSNGSYMWGIWTAFQTRGRGIWPLKIKKFKCPEVGGMLMLRIDRCIIGRWLCFDSNLLPRCLWNVNQNIIMLNSLRSLSKQSQLQPDSQAKAWLPFMNCKREAHSKNEKCRRGGVRGGCVYTQWLLHYVLLNSKDDELNLTHCHDAVLQCNTWTRFTYCRQKSVYRCHSLFWRNARHITQNNMITYSLRVIFA